MDPASHLINSDASAQPIGSEVRATGIRAIGDVPWGTHFFLFYETKEDLLDALVPYFKVGLESGEFCVWGAYKPLTAEEVKCAMRRAVPGFDRYLKNHSIEIIPGRELYLNGDEFDLKRVIRNWEEKLDYAMTHGYAGLRLSSNTAWLKKNIGLLLATTKGKSTTSSPSA